METKTKACWSPDGFILTHTELCVHDRARVLAGIRAPATNMFAGLVENKRNPKIKIKIKGGTNSGEAVFTKQKHLIRIHIW